MKTVTISEIAFTSIRGVTFWPASGKANLLSASSDAMRSEVRCAPWRSSFERQMMRRKLSEWRSLLHCFETRAGRRGPASKAAPIFEQFLDAVWQLVRQQPAAFEFGEAALLALAAEARRTDGRGPLRGDSAAERAALAPPTQTVWEVLRSHRGAPAADVDVLRPRCDAPSLAHWEALFRLAARPRGASEYSI